MLRIKRLSLQGFKSFAQLSSFEPHHAITAIVGPNGSGKSNLVDALAFVIGESQQKAIRTPRIDDVIFAGSSELSRSNQSEVRLEVLDLDKGDEYFITRRLYAGGTSDYLINAKSVRLKDLSALLVEHNLEGESSFIISQGEVEKQLVSSSIELRKWFDDVLGLSNLLEKRRLTINKIDKNNDNLAVIQNLTIEYQLQIENLKVQFIAANRFRNLKDAEAILLSKELEIDENHIQSNLIKLEQERIDYQEKVNKIIVEIETKSHTLTTKKELIYQRDIEYKLHQEEFSEQRVKYEQAKSVVNQIIFQKKTLENELSAIKLKTDSISESLIKLNSSIESLEETKLKLISQFDKEKEFHSEIQKELGVHYQEKQKADNDALEYKLNLEQIEKDVNSIEISVSNRTKQLQAAEKRVEQLISEKNVIEQKLESQDISKLLTDIQHMEADLVNQNDQYEKLSDELLNIQKELDVFSYAHREKTISLSKLTGELKGLEAFSGVEQDLTVVKYFKSLKIEPLLLKDLIDYDENEIHKLELTLGYLLNSYVVTRIESDKLTTCNDLNQLPPTVLFIIENDLSIQKTIQYGCISGPQEIIDKLIEFKINDNNQPFFEISSNIMRIGTGKTAIQDSLKRQKRIKTLKVMIAELEIQIETDKTQICDLSNKLNSITEKRNILNKLKNEKRIILDQTSSKYKKMVSENKYLLERNSEIKVLLPELNSNIEISIKEIDNLKHNLQSKQNNLSSLSDKYKSIKSNLEEITFKHNHMNNSLKSKVELLSKIDRDLIKLNLEIKENQTNHSNNSNQKTELNSRIEETSLKLSLVLNQLSQLKLADTQIEEQDIQRTKDKLLEEDNLLKELRKEFEQLSNEMRRLELEKVQLESRKYRFDEETESLNNQLALLINRKESENREYLPLESVNCEFPNFDLPEIRWIEESIELTKISKRRIREWFLRLENALEYLGNVNLLAEPQLKELETKLLSYTSQIEDLKTAQENLLQSESELKVEAINRLNSRLKETEQNFHTIFKTLFGSGTCNIKLQNLDDVLYSPIDVQIQLPGKKTTNLNLLSGGERSLLFIALFFAANAVSSCGFLILDEVDAALDDANIIKFKRLIKEWSKRMQIIIVSHNRTTMEIADKLIGVVNQPKGVSIVVPVELQEASKKFHYN